LIEKGAKVSGKNMCVIITLSVLSIFVKAKSYIIHLSFGKDAVMYAKERNHCEVAKFLSNEWLGLFSLMQISINCDNMFQQQRCV